MSAKAAFINKEIWNIDDWLDLSPMAKLVYLTLATSPDLSLCGGHEWDPSRLRERIGGELEPIVDGGVELEDHHVIVVDRNTREALIRSHMRHDQLCRKPNIAIAAARSRKRLVSRHLRGVVVFEMNRIKSENPGWRTTWEAEDVIDLLGQKSIDPKGEDRTTILVTSTKSGQNNVISESLQVGHGADGSLSGSPDGSSDGSTQPSEEPLTGRVSTSKEGHETVKGTVNGTVKGTVNRKGSAPSSSSIKKIRSTTASSSGYSKSFLAWWPDYPRKVAKGAAAKQFEKAIKIVELETLQAATRRFAHACQGKEIEYIPHPATWLSGRRWEDDDAATTGMSHSHAVSVLRDAWKGEVDSALAQLGPSPFVVEWPDPMPDTPAERDAVRRKLWQKWLESHHDDLITALTGKQS